MKSRNPLHVGFMDREIIDQARHCGKDGTDSAANYAVESNHPPRPGRTGGGNDVTHQGKYPKPNRKTNQHRMQRMFLDACRTGHNFPPDEATQPACRPSAPLGLLVLLNRRTPVRTSLALARKQLRPL